MSEALDKVLKSVEPNDQNGWIEWALVNYWELGDEHDMSIADLAAEETAKLRDEKQGVETENAQLRARVAELELERKRILQTVTKCYRKIANGKCATFTVNDCR